MRGCLRPLLCDESGASAIDYSLLAALISVAIIGVAAVVGGDVSDTFHSIATAISAIGKP